MHERNQIPCTALRGLSMRDLICSMVTNRAFGFKIPIKQLKANALDKAFATLGVGHANEDSMDFVLNKSSNRIFSRVRAMKREKRLSSLRACPRSSSLF